MGGAEHSRAARVTRAVRELKKKKRIKSRVQHFERVTMFMSEHLECKATSLRLYELLSRINRCVGGLRVLGASAGDTDDSAAGGDRSRTRRPPSDGPCHGEETLSRGAEVPTASNELALP